eukprot:15441786-Alexandrium_andersonii.AAC.1
MVLADLGVAAPLATHSLDPAQSEHQRRRFDQMSRARWPLNEQAAHSERGLGAGAPATCNRWSRQPWTMNKGHSQ